MEKRAGRHFGFFGFFGGFVLKWRGGGDVEVVMQCFEISVFDRSAFCFCFLFLFLGTVRMIVRYLLIDCEIDRMRG